MFGFKGLMEWFSAAYPGYFISPLRITCAQHSRKKVHVQCHIGPILPVCMHYLDSVYACIEILDNTDQTLFRSKKMPEVGLRVSSLWNFVGLTLNL